MKKRYSISTALILGTAIIGIILLLMALYIQHEPPISGVYTMSIGDGYWIVITQRDGVDGDDGKLFRDQDKAEDYMIQVAKEAGI